MSTFRAERRIIRVITVLTVMATFPAILHTQIRSQQTFTLIDEYMLSETVRFPTFLAYSTPSTSGDLLYFEPKSSSLVLTFSSGNGTFSGRKVLAVIPPPTAITVGNLNNDGVDDIIAVVREQNKIVALISNKTDSVYSVQAFSVNYYPEQVIIGDLNGDKIADIIACGRLSTGVSVIRGKGGEKFHASKTIFPSVAIGSVSIINLNNDKIPDVAVHNWLTNEDIFYFGIGNMQFSEQTILSYGSDSTVSVFADVNSDDITDVVVSSQQLKTIAMYHGDGLGNLNRVQNVSLQQIAAGIVVGRVHSPGFPDILVRGYSGNQISLMINRSDGSFYDEIIFGLPYEQKHILMHDLDGDAYEEIICFDHSSNRYTVMWNAHSSFPYTQNDRYAVGSVPSNLSISDLNNDGFDDILVSNLGSHTISILYGSGGRIRSQVSVETSDDPTNVIVYSKNDSAITLFTVHANSSTIGLIVLNAIGDTMESLIGEMVFYTIPLPGKPSFVLPDIALMNKTVSMYVFSRTQPNAISFYQQLQGTTFIAKSLTPQIPAKIIFSTISDLNDDGHTDLVYLYKDRMANRDFLGATLNDEYGEFSGATYSVAIPETSASRAVIYVEDINSDQQKDFIIYNPSAQTLTAITGKENGDFGEIRQIGDSVSVNTVHQIQIADFDSDGINDIIYADAERNTLFFLKGRGNGTFLKKEMIGSIPFPSAFRIGDINGDGNNDVVFTCPAENAIGILYAK